MNWEKSGAVTREYITSTAYVYADEMSAGEAIANYRSTAEDCTSWMSGGLEGGDYAFAHTQELLEADVGDEAFGIVQETSAPTVPEVPAHPSHTVVARTAEVVVVTHLTPDVPGAPFTRVLEYADITSSRLDSDQR